MRRWIAAALVVMGIAVGSAACGSDDDGGVVESPATTSRGVDTTRGSDYSG